MIQKILDGKKLTTRFRDEMNIQRYEIINNYSKENSEQGEFYYVYNKRSDKRSDNTFGIVEHKNGENGKNIGIQECQLPKDAGVDSVLRVENGKFVLDKDATAKIQEEITEMINRLLEEQTNTLKSQRIEGHLYEVIRKLKDTVELIDVTNNTGECFEEIDFPSVALETVKNGNIFQYINGTYKLYLND